jgi:hypothetical protein
MEASPQDLHLINEAVVPLHTVVPNPCTLLAQIPPGTAYYSALDLNNAFFCILLHPKSQPIFAFEDPLKKVWTGHLDCPPPEIQRQPLSQFHRPCLCESASGLVRNL